MTAAVDQTGPVHRPTSAGAQTLVGTGTLVRFALRRDRIKLPAWLLGSTIVLLYLSTVVSGVLEDEDQREDVGRFMEGAIGAFFGPGYGRDNITTERYVAGVYGLIFFVIAALMSLHLVCRHTRAEEQNGRTELVRANLAGRHAPLTAALIVAAGANALLALLLAGAMTAQGFAADDGLLFGCSVGAVGLVFAGFTALTVQVFEHSRAATGLAGAALGVAWVLRVAGDMTEDYGAPLSWFSPLAWSNQTRPYVDGRWWPLLLSVGLAAVTAAGGYALSTHRDTGAGLLAARAGTPTAAGWLRSPLAVAFRLQRSSIIWWTGALAAFGFAFGGFAKQMTDPEGMSQDRIDMFGGSVDTLVDGYLGVITLFTASLAGVMVVLAIQAVRGEEIKGRAEPVLATATSRVAWLGSYLFVVSGGLVVLLLVVGLATGAGAAIAANDGAYIAKAAAAHLAHVPAVLVLLGLAALLFGVLPRAIGLTWIMLGLSLFHGLFGSITELPSGLRALLPAEHTGMPPLDDLSWPAMGVLLATAGTLALVGLAGFRLRNLG